MGHRRRLFLLALVLAFVLGTGCSSRQILGPSPSPPAEPPLRQGDEVEYLLSPSPQEDGIVVEDAMRGRFFHAVVKDLSMEEGWVNLEGEGGVGTVPFHRIGRIRVLRERSEPNSTGIRKSLIAGGAIAGISGLISLGLSDECEGWFCMSDRDAMLGLGLGTGILVGAIGTVGGLFGEEETWEEIQLSRVRPSVQLTPSGRLGIAVSVPTRR